MANLKNADVAEYVRIGQPASDPHDAVRKEEFDGAVDLLNYSAHAAVTVEDSTSIAFSLTGQKISGQVIVKPSGHDAGEGKILITALGLVFVIGTGANEAAAGNHGHSAATTGAAGFMSSADKAKLDAIASGATRILLADNGSAPTAARSDHGHDNADEDSDGFMSMEDYTKLAGIAAGAVDAEGARDAVTSIIQDSFSIGSVYIDDGVNPGTLTFNVRLKASGFDSSEGAIVESSGGLAVRLGTSENTAAAGNHTHAEATPLSAGFMSAEDKVRLDAVVENADWLPSVATYEDLPLNTDPVGVVRMVRATGIFYRCVSTVGFRADQWAYAVAAPVTSLMIGSYARFVALDLPARGVKLEILNGSDVWVEATAWQA